MRRMRNSLDSLIYNQIISVENLLIALLFLNLIFLRVFFVENDPILSDGYSFKAAEFDFPLIEGPKPHGYFDSICRRGRHLIDVV